MFVYTAGATAIARDLSVSATYIGYQISIAYFAATLCTLFSGGITRRLGAVSPSRGDGLCRHGLDCNDLIAVDGDVYRIDHYGNC